MIKYKKKYLFISFYYVCKLVKSKKDLDALNKLNIDYLHLDIIDENLLMILQWAPL